MDKKIKKFFQIVNKYEQYIEKKYQEYQIQKNNHVNKNNGSNNSKNHYFFELIHGENDDRGGQEQNDDILKDFNFDFFTLKQYIDENSKTKKYFFLNSKSKEKIDFLIDILNRNEYHKRDIEHQKKIGEMIKSDFKRYEDNQKSEKIKLEIEKKKKIENEKLKIQSIIPKLNGDDNSNIGEWNKFRYDLFDIMRIEKDIILFFSGIGIIFQDIFLSLKDSIHCEEDLIRIINTNNIPFHDMHEIKESLEFRRYIFYLGFLFHEPMFEKELNQHVLYFCMLLWWMKYGKFNVNLEKKMVYESIQNLYNRAVEHYRYIFLPIFQKISRSKVFSEQFQHIFFKNHGLFHFLKVNENENVSCDSDIDMIHVFIHHQAEEIDHFKKVFTTPICIEMNLVFKDLFHDKLQNVKKQNENGMVIHFSGMNQNVVSSSSSEDRQSEDFFKGNELLNWFIDTTPSNFKHDFILSKMTRILMYDDNENKDEDNFKKFIVMFKSDHHHTNYRCYRLLCDYFVDINNILKRIIPSNDLSKAPMMHLSPYLYNFLASVTLNFSFFENENNLKTYQSTFYEHLLYNIIFLIESNEEDIRWFMVHEDNKYDEWNLNNVQDVVHYLMNYYDNDNKSKEDVKKIVYLIFERMAKRSLLHAAEIVVSLLMKNDKSEEHYQFLSHKMKMDFKKMNMMLILNYLFFNTSIGCSIRFFVSLRNIQFIYQNEYKKKIEKSRSHENGQSQNENQFKKKEMECFKKIALLLENKHFLTSLIDGEKKSGKEMLVHFFEMNQENSILNDFNDKTNQVYLDNLVDYLFIHLIHFITNQQKMKSKTTLKSYASYTSNTMIISQGYLKNIDACTIDNFKIVLNQILKSFSVLHDFLNEIKKYFKKSSLNTENDTVNILNIIFSNFFNLKSKNVKNELTKLHDLFRMFVLIKIFYCQDRKNEMLKNIDELIGFRKIYLQNQVKMEQNKKINFKEIGKLSKSENNIIEYNISHIFKYQIDFDLKKQFDYINICFQMIFLFSHHYDWTDIGNTMNGIYLKKMCEKESFYVDIDSYHDLNEENSSMIKIKNILFDVKKLKEAIFMCMNFERFFIERTKKNGNIFTSIDGMYQSAIFCQKNLQQNDCKDKIELISNTPESKMIATLIQFLSYHVITKFKKSTMESNYPEDCFVALLCSEDSDVIVMMQTIFNFIFSVFSRLKMMHSLSNHLYLKNKEDENVNEAYQTDFYILNPLKYFIRDSLFNHAFYIRLMHKYIKKKSELSQYVWFALPSNLTMEHVGKGNNKEKTLQFLRNNRVKNEFFSKKYNPKAYIAWRLWFNCLSFVDNSILLNETKPIRGRVYFLTDQLISKPQFSDSLVLNFSNISDSSASSSSSSRQLENTLFC